jgi:hypothetical protein
MKANFSNVYTKRTQTGAIDVFVYHVTGTDDELQAYKDAQGANYREDDTTGKPLFFMTQFAGDDVTIIITTTGRVVADTSAFKKAKSLANQYDFMKEHIAAAMVASLGIGKQTVRQLVTAPNQPVSAPVQQPVAESADTIEGFNPFGEDK